MNERKEPITDSVLPPVVQVDRQGDVSVNLSVKTNVNIDPLVLRLSPVLDTVHLKTSRRLKKN